MNLDLYSLKQKLKKIKPLYSWFCMKRKKRSCKLLQLNGYDISNKITEIFKNSNISYFYTYGTLLGLVRDGDFIKHDNDIDIGIINTKDFSWKNLSLMLTQKGFYKLHEFTLDGKITEQTYIFNGTSVDFFLYELELDKMISFVYFRKKDCIYTNKYEKSVSKIISSKIIDFKDMEVNNIKFRVPKNANQYLKDVYGEKWKIPNPDWVSEDGPAWNELKGTYGIYVPSK